MFKRFLQKIISAGLIVSVAIICYGCAATQTDMSPPAQVWEGSLTGMITGTITLNIQDIQEVEDTKVVSGQIVLQLHSIAGGYGRGHVKGDFKGEINDDLFEATFKGFAAVTDGTAFVSGTLSGILSDTTGQGNLFMRTQTEAGDLSGKWTLNKK